MNLDPEMPGFLNLPLELRNRVYEMLLWEELVPSFRGVMVVSEPYVKRDLPLRCYRSLLRVCRQVYYEFKRMIQHLVASKQLNYTLDITFSHGRPYFSLIWIRFPCLSRTINQLDINIDLRTREPFRDGPHATYMPDDHELTQLLEDSHESFAVQLFDYIAILLKTLATLLAYGNSNFSILYTEVVTLNFRTPTKVIPPVRASHHQPVSYARRIPVNRDTGQMLHETMRRTMEATSRRFKAFDASECDRLTPLIQIGSLRFATEGVVWGEGHNLVLAHDDFQWLRY